MDNGAKNKRYNPVPGGSGSGSGSGGSSKFTANIPVILAGGKSLGRYANGSTIPAIGKTAEEVLRDIALEFIPPVVGFSLSTGLVERSSGVSIAHNSTITTTFNNAIGSRQTIERGAAMLIDDSTLPLSTSKSIANSLLFSSATPSYSYTATVYFSNYATQVRSAIINSVHPSYIGVGASNMLDAVTTSSGLGALMTKNIRNSKAQSAVNYTLTLQRFFYVYPASLGDLTSIKDPNNFEVLPSFTKSTKNITMGNGDVVTYNLYISNDDTTQINFKLSFS